MSGQQNEVSSSCKNKDIIVFTLHKSASMFIHKICEYLSQTSNITHFSPNSTTAPINEHSLLTENKFWQTHHGCFAPVRFYVNVPSLDDYNIILHLRDPRDVLVSMYFSYCYIHAGPVEANTGYRKEIAEKGIDNFVLSKAREGRESTIVGGYGTGGPVQHLTGGIVTKYNDLLNNLSGRSNVTLVKYEEMVTDFRSWLEKIIVPFPIQDKPATIDYLLSLKPQFFPKRTDDVMVHTRRITPGDHIEKLQRETIDELNFIFKDILEKLNYSTS